MTGIALGTLILFGSLQLDRTQEYLADLLTEQFDESFEGQMTVERIDGLLPFNTRLHNVRLYTPDKDREADFTIEEVILTIQPWDLLRETISIRSFELHQPQLLLYQLDEERTNFDAIFSRTVEQERSGRYIDIFDKFGIYAPQLSIFNGSLILDGYERSAPLPLPSPLLVDNIQTGFHLDLAERHRQLDIDRFSFDIHLEETLSLRGQGQLFSDDEVLEMNAIQLESGDSRFRFSAYATPIDFTQPNLPGQFSEASYWLETSASVVSSTLLGSLYPGFPIENELIDFELSAEGTLDSLNIDRLRAGIGNSLFQAQGQVTDIENEIHYNGNFELENLDPEQPDQWLGSLLKLDSRQTEFLGGIRAAGQVTGDRNRLESNLIFQSPNGSLQLEGSVSWDENLVYQATLEVDSLDLGPLFADHIDNNLIHGSVHISGTGSTLDELQGTLSADLYAANFNHIEIDRSIIEARLEENRLTHQMTLHAGPSFLQSEGTVLRNPGNSWNIRIGGSMAELSLSQLFQDDNLPELVTAEFQTDLNWSHLDDLYGRISLDVDQSVVSGDTLASHQFYADLDSPSEPGDPRNLRITSSFLDASLQGDLYPEQLFRLSRYWTDYFQRQIAEELRLTDSAERFPDLELTEPGPAQISMELNVKDLAKLESYLGGFGQIRSRASVTLNLDIGPDQLLLTGRFSDAGMRITQITGEELQGSLTANFFHDTPFREQSTLDLQLQADRIAYKDFELESGLLSLSMLDDSLSTDLTAGINGDDLNLNLGLTTRLYPGRVHTRIDRFEAGDEEYRWSVDGTPNIYWSEDRSVVADRLYFVHNDSRVEIDGIFSDQPEHYVDYRFRNLDLELLSDIVGGRVTFSGSLDGDLTTRTLFQQPSFEGTLQVNSGQLVGRQIGDISISSLYTADEDRFQTSIAIYTDPERYPEYLEANDGIGQNLHLEGWFKAPDLDNPEEQFFHFDADLREIDLWIATVIVPDILEQVEGRAEGYGSIQGSLRDFDFNAHFDIDGVIGEPAFVNTRYRLDGQLEFDRHTGLTFHNLNLRDDQGGRGFLTGTIDLDDFSDYTYLDLALEMDGLRFMNNPYDPDIPFYANARGTGQVQLTGSNFEPYLRTTGPVRILPGSRISVPVLDEAELQHQRHSFIQFVDSFDLEPLIGQPGTETGSRDSPFQFNPESQTFIERFRLDLQFTADDPVAFQLIFDRVTNEILTANSTGQLRLTLEDQNVNLFGRAHINNGDYQFVVGDIISRRFQLVEGGSITWEGDPANARLNVDATYRARPDLTALMTTGMPDGLEGSQRIPVDLILNIGGTISELENEFYFDIPSNIEGTLDPAIVAQLNTLNSNEDEKIVQATSLLLSGNFIPMATATAEGGSGMALMETLTGGTVVSPLITGQVINPLLSDQINSLLRSDMALDIDFNLTYLNQIDLGVALRLYDDRLILRRDGEITGPYSDIGDLGATYRINRTFAVTAFHRQDPTLSNTSATEPRQVQEMNGVGLEAQVQFNTWREFRQRFTNAIARLFGLRNDDEEEDGTDEEAELIAFD